MARAARHLLEGALRTQKAEDQLTEILAVALQEHGAFRDCFLEEAGLSLGAGTDDRSAEVRTQRLTPGGRFVDLEVVIREGGTPVARLWCENKVGAAYQPNQLRDYRDALRDADGPQVKSCLVTIVLGADVAGAERVIGQASLDDVPVWTWESVGAIAETAGRRAASGAQPDRSTGSWRDRPASATQRTLSELLWYLNRKEDVMTTELKPDHAVALGCFDEAEKIARALCEQGIKRSETPVAEDSGIRQDGKWEWHKLQASHPLGVWAEMGAHPELYRDQWDKFVYEHTGAAAIFVGMTVPREHAESLTGEACVDWRKAIEKHDFTVLARADDSHVRVFRPLYLLEVAARFASFDAQVDAVAGHIDQSLDYLLNEEPPPSVAAESAEQSSRAAGGAGLERN
jgi:hypothetical protein